MSKLRTITIDPQFLSISKKKQKSQKTNIPLSEVKLNSTNIRELLLEKLKQHKKNKKTLKNPVVQLNSIDENSTINKENTNIPTNLNATTDNIQINVNNEIDKLNLNSELNLNNEMHTLETLTNNNNNLIKPDKPYGILKNGNRPTYKTWSNNDQINEIIEQPVSLIQDIEVKKVFNLGKNKKNKTVSVLLKNNLTRKKIESDKVNYKKTNLSTVKHFLKKQNLIKFGTTAPNNLLREMYENTKLCGEISNDNSASIIHNFKEE